MIATDTQKAFSLNEKVFLINIVEWKHVFHISEKELNIIGMETATQLTFYLQQSLCI